MRYDIYDIDEDRWACWDTEKGYLSEWLTKKQYQKWWWLRYGVFGKMVPGSKNAYRGDADQWEKKRVERSSKHET